MCGLASKGQQCDLVRCEQRKHESGEIEGDVSPAFTKSSLRDGSQIYEIRVDIGTAGSTLLAMQAVLPFILFSKFPSQIPIHLHLSGGTNVSGFP